MAFKRKSKLLFNCLLSFFDIFYCNLDYVPRTLFWTFSNVWTLYKTDMFGVSCLIALLVSLTARIWVHCSFVLVTTGTWVKFLTVSWNSKFVDIIRSGSRAAATSKMELCVIIVNDFQPLTIITKRSILDVAAVLDPPLISNFFDKIKFRNYQEQTLNHIKSDQTFAYFCTFRPIGN